MSDTAVPTPMKRQLQHLRYQVLPVVSFLLCAGLCAWLWSRQGVSGGALGEVSAVSVRVVSPVDGLLSPADAPYPKLYDKVGQRQVVAQIGGRAIETPLAGTVTAIQCQVGEIVKVGQEIMTVTQDRGGFIVSYVRPDARVMPAPQMPVSVRAGKQTAVARVAQVGSAIERIPEHVAAGRKDQWGIPIRIELPDGLALRPGELVGIRFMK